MPNTSYLEMLQNPQSEMSPMGALRGLSSAVGNAWQGYEGRNDEQDLMKFFMDGETTPEKIQEFSSLHPRMPLQDIYVKASLIGRQKDAREIKDASKTAMNWLKTADITNMTPQKFQEFVQGLNLPPGAEKRFVVDIFPKVVEVVKNMKEFGKKDITVVPKGAAVLGNTVGGNIVELYSNEEDKLIDITSPDGKATAKIPESRFNNDAFPEWKGWTQGTPTRLASVVPKTLDSIGIDPVSKKTVYKGGTGNVFADGTPAPSGQLLPVTQQMDTTPTGLPLPGNMVQEQRINPVTGQLENYGVPYSRHKPEDVGTKEDQVIAREQQRLARAQQAATRDLEKKYIHDSLTGQWLDDGNKPVKMATIKQEYEQLVTKHYGGARPSVSPPVNNNPLFGKPAGRYRVNGKEVKWDGTKEL